MCGIAGIYNYQTFASPDPDLLARMAKTMHHRGPDDEGLFVDGPMGLVHRRLSIIDLEGGHQPIFNEDGSIAVVFNGEIYNHLELRGILESKGHTFKTRSDTEVIVHSYEEFGERFIEHFQGMFAFALWDGLSRKLILGRDRIGIKPLYYADIRGVLVFGSEIKCLLEYPGLEREVDLASLDAYMHVRYVPGPRTMFQNVYKLPPGEMLVCHRGSIVPRRYWEISYDGILDAEDEQLQDEMLTLLLKTMKSHLMSEVPQGVFLSGGVDSSLIVALMSRVTNRQIKTFSIGFDAGTTNIPLDDLTQARKVSDFYQTDHHQYVLSAGELEKALGQLIWNMDEPVADSAAIPLFFISRLARQHITVAQSGEGADELLGGYTIYRKMRLLSRLQQVPGVLSLARLAKPSFRICHNPRLLNYASALSLPLEKRYRGVSSVFNDDLRHALYDSRSTRQHGYFDDTYSRYYAQVPTTCDLNRMLYIDLKTWLPDDLLLKADKMTMATSLELRVPFLDANIVEFVARLPEKSKIRGDTGKFLLKRVAEKLLPSEIVYQKKRGFPVPIERWLRHQLYGQTAERLLAHGNATGRYFNTTVIKTLLEEHQSGKHNWANEIWALLVFEEWHSAFMPQFHSSS